MGSELSSENFPATIEVGALKNDELLLKSMVGVDKVSQPYSYMVEAVVNPTKKKQVDLSGLLGKKASITLRPARTVGKDRYFHGYVFDCRYGGASGGNMESYYLRVEPWLCTLKKSFKCRLFKGLKVDQILEAVFKSYEMFTEHFKLDLDSEIKLPEMEHCVQYQESDFAFVSRLMEEFGISYYFEHTKTAHKMVLLNSSGKRPTDPPTCGFKEMKYDKARLTDDLNTILRWEGRLQFVSDKFTQLDYNYASKTKFPDIATYKEPGKGKVSEQGDFTTGKFEKYVYEGIFIDDGVSEPYTDKNIKEFEKLNEVRVRALEAERELKYLESESRGVHAGYEFKLTGYDEIDTEQNNKEYYVLSVRHQLELGDYGTGASYVSKTYTCTATAIPKDTEYYPPLLTPKARIYGPQTAMVVGGSDKKDELIYTDKLGRIKVKFHWDRLEDRKEIDKSAGEKAAKVEEKPENQSCWVRVSQGWAGDKWGSFFLPRVGQEVIVEFLDGDPDRPIVTGSVYNGKSLTPYKLPDNDTVSTVKTDTLGTDGKKAKEANYNEIRFEDREESEQIYIHAAKAMDFEIMGDRRETVGGNIHLVVGYKEEGNSKYDKKRSVDKKIGNRVVLINEGGHDVLTLDKGDTVTNIKEGNQHLMVGKDQNVTVSGEQKISTGGVSLVTGGKISVTSEAGVYLHEKKTEIHIKSAKGAYLEDEATIHIKSGSSGTFITSDGDVHVKGANIVLAADTKLQLAAGGSLINLSSGGVEIKGTAVDINTKGSAGKATAATAATAAKPSSPGSAPAPEVQVRLTTGERVDDGKVKTKKINPGTLD